jgi:hypothetical protein
MKIRKKRDIVIKILMTLEVRPKGNFLKVNLKSCILSIWKCIKLINNRVLNSMTRLSSYFLAHLAYHLASVRPKNHPCQVWLSSVQGFQRRRFKCESYDGRTHCSYMARSSLAYIPGFSVKFFFQPIYADYANWAYFDKRSHLNLLL